MRLSACLLLALAGISDAAAQPPAHPALAAWAAAWEADDPAALLMLYAPGARVWTPGARVLAAGRAEIAYALALDRSECASRRLVFGNHAWRQHGTFALASGIALARFEDEDGVRTPMALRFSMAWEHDGRRWAIVEQHLSLLAFDDE